MTCRSAPNPVRLRDFLPADVLAGLAHDRDRLLMRLGDNRLALANDPLGLLDLIWNGNPELVDQRQELVLLDHDLAVKRHALAETDQLLEAVEQVEDVDRGVVDRVGGLVWFGRRKEAVVLERLQPGVAALVEWLTWSLADPAWLEVNVFSHGRANRFCKAFRT